MAGRQSEGLAFARRPGQVLSLLDADEVLPLGVRQLHERQYVRQGCPVRQDQSQGWVPADARPGYDERVRHVVSAWPMRACGRRETRRPLALPTTSRS